MLQLSINESGNPALAEKILEILGQIHRFSKEAGTQRIVLDIHFNESNVTIEGDDGLPVFKPGSIPKMATRFSEGEIFYDV